MFKFIVGVLLVLWVNVTSGNNYEYFVGEHLSDEGFNIAIVNLPRLKRDDGALAVDKSPNKASKIYTSTVVSLVNSSSTSLNESDISEFTKSPSDMDQGDPDELSSSVSSNVTEVSGNSFSNVTKDEYHKFYYSYVLQDPKVFETYWFDFTDLNDSAVHPLLSNSHRQAAPLTLSFGFPYFGQIIKKITLTTGGFLYTGGYMHNWLAATQYIAPLMANFDTNVSDYSCVKYYDNKTAFIVQWENVVLKDHDTDLNFTFQVILKENGDILFNYKDVPIPITRIRENDHPVKVGLSDAYFMDSTIHYVRRKTIYEYSKVTMKHASIANKTTLYFKALPTCLKFTDCVTCLTTHINFTCSWCDAEKRCSDGIDRLREQWIKQGCEINSIKNESMCNVPHQTEANETVHVHEEATTERHHAEEVELANAGIVVGVIVVIGLIIAVLGWLFYAFKFPLTPSGQLLIRYRPSQWRRGEARYTPAVSRS